MTKKITELLELLEDKHSQEYVITITKDRRIRIEWRDLNYLCIFVNDESPTTM